MIRLFVRAALNHLYHSLAWSYDLVAASVSLGQWQDWTLRALDYLEGRRVLELGFGPGHLQLALHQRGFDACGLDESRQMASLATRSLLRRGHRPRLTRGAAQALPFAPGCFDTVLATFPTEYIVDTRTLSEISRVLAPGGRLVVLPMAWVGGHRLLAGLLRALFRITGQAQPISEAITQHISAPYETAGFTVDIQTVTEKGSTLVFVLARKPGPL